MALKQACAERAEVRRAAYQTQLDQWISEHHWLGKDVEFLGTNTLIKLTVTPVVVDAIIITLVTCKELQFPWKWLNSLVEQFTIKENWRVRCWPSFKRICFFLPVSQLSHSCLGRYWEPPAFLAPVSFAVYQPNQGEARSREALGWSAPKLTFFFPSSGKTWEDIRCSEALSFCPGAADGHLGAYNTWPSHTAGASTAGLVLHTALCWNSASSNDGGPRVLALLTFDVPSSDSVFN